MGYSIWYEVTRAAPLSDEERALIEEHLARHAKGKWKVEGYRLQFAPKPNVLVSGITKLPYDPDHRDVQRVLAAVSELRRLLPDAEFDVNDDFEFLIWDSAIGEYRYDDGSYRKPATQRHEAAEPPTPVLVVGVDSRVHESERREPALAPLEPPGDETLWGALALTRAGDEGIVTATLAASLEKELVLTIELQPCTGVRARQITIIGRTRDGAPCLAKTIYNTSDAAELREQLQVDAGFRVAIAAFELAARVEYPIDSVIASFDAKATRASKDQGLVAIELEPRVVDSIGVEVASLVGWTVSPYGDQEMRLFARAKSINGMRHDVDLRFELIDEAGAQLEYLSDLMREPHEIVRASRTVDATFIDRLRRVDVRAKGRVEGDVPLGLFRVR